MHRNAEDYGQLIHFQLEVLLCRQSVYQDNSKIVTDAQKDALLNEVRELLYRRDVIAHALSRGVAADYLTGWSADDKESVSAAQKFLAAKSGNVSRARGFPLKLVVNQSDKPNEQASRPAQPLGIIRVGNDNPSGSVQ